MSKEIAGVKIDPTMARRRGKRGQKAQEQRAKGKKEAKEIIEGVPNFATKQLERNANYAAFQSFKNGRAQHALISNAPFDGQAKSRQYASNVISPKKRLRFFLKDELSNSPDLNGRYAVYAGFSARELPSNFITAFTNKPAADTARMLAFKEGTYITVSVVDRGPGFHFETVHKVRRSA